MWKKKLDSSTERITDFFYCTVYADEFGLMCLSYCDDDVLYRRTWEKVYEPQYIRLTQHCIQFCK